MVTMFAVLDIVFSPLSGLSPAVAIALFSVLFSFLAVALNIILIKKSVREEIKTKMDYLQKRFKEVQKSKDIKQMQEVQQQQLEVQMNHLRQSLKPTIVMLLLFLVIFNWIQTTYSNFHIAIYPINYNVGVIGWYILVALAAGLVFRKLFDLR